MIRWFRRFSVLSVLSVIHVLAIALFSASLASADTSLTEAQVNGVYHLGIPERGQKKVLMQYGQLGANKVIAVAACQGCPPAVYQYQEEPSKTLKTPIFMTAGLYLIRYDDDSFVLVQADKELGRAVWETIGHANVYSKKQSTANTLARPEIESFALNLSRSIMNQNVGALTHAEGVYHLAAPMTHRGNAQRQYQVRFGSDANKSIAIQPCSDCYEERYEWLPNESSIIGVDVYRYATGNYLFDLKDGVLAYTSLNGNDLGRSEWGEHSTFNVFSNNQAYIRKVLTSQSTQDSIESTLSTYFSEIKQVVEQQAKALAQTKTESRTLPAEGLQDATLGKLAFESAQRWAKDWDWKENLKSVYFTSADWSTQRHPLTGILTGRTIQGVITMSHPDGRCRFQYAGFRQDHDGQVFKNMHMTGVGPIYDILCERI